MDTRRFIRWCSFRYWVNTMVEAEYNQVKGDVNGIAGALNTNKNKSMVTSMLLLIWKLWQQIQAIRIVRCWSLHIPDLGYHTSEEGTLGNAVRSIASTMLYLFVQKLVVLWRTILELYSSCWFKRSSHLKPAAPVVEVAPVEPTLHNHKS